MFGLSFGELCLLIIVAIVVIGPKDMPKVLRKAGQLAARLRRMATDVRAQSGIDEVLRADGLHQDLAEIRKLAQADFLSPIARPAPSPSPIVQPSDVDPLENPVVREREYPSAGPDNYDAVPDSAILYHLHSIPSPLAKDPLYVLGDPNGVVPEPEPEPLKPDPATEPAATTDPAPLSEQAPDPRLAS